jgi:hypothetical protein
MAQHGHHEHGFGFGLTGFMRLALSLLLIQGCASLRPRSPLPQYLVFKIIFLKIFSNIKKSWSGSAG